MPRIEGQRIFSCPVEKLFSVALAIERYPDILPYVKSVRILSREEGRIAASLTLGLSFMTLTYGCEIHYKPNMLIEVRSRDPGFTRFGSRCLFEQLAERTRISYALDARFAQPVLELLARAVMPYQADATLRAFERYLNAGGGL